VLPAPRWSEFARAASGTPRNAPWPLSVLADPNAADTIARICKEGAAFVDVQSVECKAQLQTDVKAIEELVGLGVDVFVEPSGDMDFGVLAPELALIGACGKIRTGGTSVDAIPSARRVAAFMADCRNARIRFKATAGLHHAVRGEYPLTYDPSPPTGVMFGFLNVAVAAAMLWFERDEETVVAALEETSSAAFDLSDAGAAWRDERLTVEQLSEVRSAFFIGFGSCSFREPMAEVGLEALPRA
jgi:hypothetical protein